MRVKALKEYFSRDLNIGTKNILVSSWIVAFGYFALCVVIEFILWEEIPMIVRSTPETKILICLIIVSGFLIALLHKFEKNYILWSLAAIYYFIAFLIVNISGGVLSPFLGIYTLTMFGVFIIANKWQPIIFFLVFMSILLVLNCIFGHNVAPDIATSEIYEIKCALIAFFSIVMFAIVEYLNRNGGGNKSSSAKQP